MTDEQIIEIAKRLYGGNLTAEDLSTHQTIEFARLIEQATREECADDVEYMLGRSCNPEITKNVTTAIRSQK